MSLIDQHGRVVNYIRLAVTDRCNLRCHYCMPAEGIDYVDRQELLTYEEMERLLIILSREGVDKVRITGGEPFLRKGMMDFLTSLSQIRALDQIHITTNGTLTKDLVPQLKHLGISGINLSLDSLDKERFSSITRRDNFDDVITTLVSLLEHQIPTKINMVVMKDQNLEDIHEMIELSRDKDISVRFIEEMPFNGSGVGFSGLEWNYQRILEHIMTSYGDIEKIQDGPYSTSLNYRIKDFKGTFGIIPAYSRTFCGTCNRIRVTPTGTLKTCLYDQGVFNIKDSIRGGANDRQIVKLVQEALAIKAINGVEAEKMRHQSLPVKESMATIGG